MATLSHINNSLVSLFNASNDAQNNLFEIAFSGGVFGNDASILQRITVRTDSFSAPSTSQESYEVNFANVTVKRPAAKVNVDRMFTFTFRVDANYQLYNILINQQALLFNSDTSKTAYNIKALADGEYLFTASVNILSDSIMSGSETSTIQLFKFNNCWISEITPLSFSRDDSGPHTVQVTVRFIDMEDYFEE